MKLLSTYILFLWGRTLICNQLFENLPLNRMLIEKPEFKKAIGYLCVFPDDEDKLSVIYRALMGAWCSNKGQIFNLKELIQIAGKGLEVDYFIGLEPTKAFSVIPDNTREILDKIENFDYKIDEGILRVGSEINSHFYGQ